MNIADVFALIAAVIFGVEAFIHRSLLAAGLCIFALSFVIGALL